MRFHELAKQKWNDKHIKLNLRWCNESLVIIIIGIRPPERPGRHEVYFPYTVDEPLEEMDFNWSDIKCILDRLDEYETYFNSLKEI